MLLNCGVREDSWESLRLQGHPNSPSSRKSVLNIHWKDWCWSRNCNTLATWWEELTHLKRPWCWERLKAEGEGDDREWDGWMASPSQWTWVWVNSGSWWWTGRPGMLQSMGLQRFGHEWMTELNWFNRKLQHHQMELCDQCAHQLTPQLPLPPMDSPKNFWTILMVSLPSFSPSMWTLLLTKHAVKIKKSKP